MGSPDDEKNILELLCQKKRSTQYIHVFPGELKVYSLLDAGIRDKKGKRCLLEVQMMEFTRESLARFSAKGTPIPVRFVELPINGHEEEVKAFLQMLRKTGILLDIGGAIYGVSRTAMMKMHKQMEMYGAYDYSPIHDLMLSEKLLAAEPSGHRPTEKKSLERVDKKNAKGYTLAVSTKPFLGSSFVDGIITGMYSGWYEGTDGDGLDILCAKLLKGEIIGGEEIEMCHQENTAEHLTVEFRAGKPFRYAVSGQEHCLERGIVITDHSSGFQAFSVRGIISDRKTGDRIIVSEKKLSHYGRSKRCTDRQKKETDTAESRVRTVFAETEEFIRLIETTNMSRVYKMPVLTAFYHDGQMRMAVTEEDLLISWKAFFGNGTNWKDLDRSLTYDEYRAIPDRDHIRKIMQMPVHFLQESGKGFFVKKEGCALALRDELAAVIRDPVFVGHVKDVIDYRTMDYYQRRYVETVVERDP